MKFIELTNSKRLAVVDDNDIEKIILLNTNWFVIFRKSIALAIVSTKHFNGKHIYLARFILGCIDDNGMNADHKFHDIFDNRKENLRWLTFSQSQVNRNKQINNTSGHKNICWDYHNRKWLLRITKDGKSLFTKRFKNIEEAIKIRNIKLKEFHGEFSLCY